MPIEMTSCQTFAVDVGCGDGYECYQECQANPEVPSVELCCVAISGESSSTNVGRTILILLAIFLVAMLYFGRPYA